MTHQLVRQLRFARSEFTRCLEGISDEDARKRILPMNCISWMIGHMAVQEQYYFVFFPQGEVPYPQLNQLVGYGRPASTPPLDEMWAAWHEVTTAADAFLDTLTAEHLLTYQQQSTSAFENNHYGKATQQMREHGTFRVGERLGTRMLRAIYHYFFHTGEAHAVRQQLGHPNLPDFIGRMPDNLFL